MEMKKITLLLSAILFIGFILGACSEEKALVEKEPVEDVAAVVETPEEEVKEEEPKEEITEPAKTAEDETDAATEVKFNYENSQVGVQEGVGETLENVNTILVSGNNHAFKMDQIKSWFSDFEGSDAVLDEYLAILTKNGLTEKDLTERNSKTDKIVEGPDNVWTLDLTQTGSNGSKTVVTKWNITAQPGPTGDLVIDINSIK